MLFGAGINAQKIIPQQIAGDKIVAIWDNDPNKWGNEIAGVPIAAPPKSEISDSDRDDLAVLITVNSEIDINEIYAQLNKIGVRFIYQFPNDNELSNLDFSLLYKELESLDCPIIFYGAGRFAGYYLNYWISNGLIPACFVDVDESKHYNLFPEIPIWNKAFFESWMTSKNDIIPDNKNSKTQFEILPLSEANKRYPDAKYFISTIFDPYLAYETLLSSGIAEERIHYLKYDNPKWCKLLIEEMLIDGHGFPSCDELQSFIVERTGNFKEDHKIYMQRKKYMCKALEKGFLCTCSGCYNLRDGVKEMPDKIKLMDVGTGLIGTRCNFKCSYCNYNKNDYDSRVSENCKGENAENIMDILNIIDKNDLTERMFYSAGEIGVSPYRDEILNLWIKNKWKGIVFTNCSVYNEKLAYLLSIKQVVVRCSIDSGTKETFELIKGVPFFEKVLNNLRKYAATGGTVQIKYIILEGINDNETDIRGFINFAKEIDAVVVTSVDWRLRTNITENVRNAMLRIIQLCDEQNIKYEVLSKYIPADDLAELRAEGALI